jgi:hypothetical protein
MRLLFNAELSVDAESLEEAWQLAKEVEAEASAISEGAALVVKMASISVLDDDVERPQRRYDPDCVPVAPRSVRTAGLATRRSSRSRR